MSKPLSNVNVVITGSGSGLGAAYAVHAAELGAAVVVNDISPDAADHTAAQIRNAGGRAVSMAGDISSWAFAGELVDTCIRTFGSITGLVNNAGIFRPARLVEMTEADLRRMWEINVQGTVAGASAATRAMLSAGTSGTIINVASGSQAGDIALSGYGGTKAAIASMTYSWAMELRGTGIRVNAISPLADTAMSAQNKDLMAVQAANRDVHYASLPKPAVNAPLVCFLLSDASTGINGQLVRIADRELAYVTHPTIARPVLVDDWNFDRIVEAFAGPLRDHQRKLGLAYDGAAA